MHHIGFGAKNIKQRYFGTGKARKIVIPLQGRKLVEMMRSYFAGCWSMHPAWMFNFELRRTFECLFNGKNIRMRRLEEDGDLLAGIIHIYKKLLGIIQDRIFASHRLELHLWNAAVLLFLHPVSLDLPEILSPNCKARVKSTSSPFLTWEFCFFILHLSASAISQQEI